MSPALGRAWLAIPVLPLLMALGAAAAQSVHGTVVGPTGPVADVVVILLDSADGIVARDRSDERGAYRLATARPGTYRIRTLRLGFRTALSTPIVLGAAADLERHVQIAELRLQLDTVRVTGRNPCRLSSDSAFATFAVWEQVRAGLGAVAFTAGEPDLQSTVVLYQRSLDRGAARIREQTSALHSALVTQPWHSAAPATLRRLGFVQETGGDTVMYLAPGIDVLLSDVFVEDHCFRFAASPEATLLGIAFEPIPDRHVPEVAGVVWLDRRTSEVRRTDFRYVNAPLPRLNDAAGTMEFARLGDRRWAISRWNIRMPVLLRISSGSEARVVEYRVAGGELAVVVRGGDTLYARPPLSLAGSVVDSLTGVAVAGARLALAGTPWRVASDPAGHFAFSGVLPGEYTLEVRTASLDSVTAVSLTPVMVTDSAADLRVHVPTGQQIAASLCGATRVEAPGIVIGSVEAQGDSQPPAGVRVAAEWSQPFMRIAGGVMQRGTRPRWVEARTDARGRYRLCGVPVNVAVIIRAEADSAGATADITIPPGGRLARADLVLDAGVMTGGVLSGTVVADSTQMPIPDAEVVLSALNRGTTTNERGAFRLAGLPEGLHRVEVRRRGYGPATTEVSFTGSAAQQRQFVLSPGVAAEESAAASERALIPSFEEHRKSGRGAFLTRDELARMGRRRLSDVLARIGGGGGASVTRGRGNAAYVAQRRTAAPARRAGRQAPECDPERERCPTARQDAASGTYCPDDSEARLGIECGCYAQVYVNNLLMNRGSPTPPFDINSIAADQVEALEYYRNGSEAPGRYSGPSAECGVLVVWTRRGT